VNGVSRSRIARLLSNGQLDLSFDPGLGANFTVLVLQPQSNGKIIIGGFMTRVGVANRNHIARLNEDGTLDTIFDVGTGADATVYCLALASDTKVLVGGAFFTMNGFTRNYLARLFNDPNPLRLDLQLSSPLFQPVLRITGSPEYPVSLESSVDLKAWNSSSTGVIPVAGPWQYTDSVATAVGPRFYRGIYR